MPLETPPNAVTKNDGLMRYPVIPPPFGYDHILIESFNYVPGGIKGKEGTPFRTTDATEKTWNQQ